ncbi:MAG: glycosyltransferase family 4 protein [Bacteroidales bacterium]
MKNKVKIIHAIRQGKIGGGESHVLELVSHLDPERFESIVLSFTTGPMVEELERRGIRTQVFETETPFDIKVWRQVAAFLRREKPQMVHAHGTRAMSNLVFPARWANIPLVYTVHGWSFHNDQSALVRKIRVASERFLTRRAVQTICVSASNQEEGIRRFNLQNSRVIHNAIDLEKFDYRRQFPDLRPSLGISQGKTVVGFIARVTEQKDPFTLIRAMKRVRDETRDVVLLMVGDGNLREKTIQLARDLGITDQVVFQGFRTDVPQVLSAIDIYCLPSLWEGFPIGILEAMAMEIPVIASSIDANREMVEDGILGLLVNQGEEKKLAEAILLLHRDRRLRASLAQAARKLVCQRHGIEDLVLSVEDVYRELLRERTNPAAAPESMAYAAEAG